LAYGEFETDLWFDGGGSILFVVVRIGVGVLVVSFGGGSIVMVGHVVGFFVVFCWCVVWGGGWGS